VVTVGPTCSYTAAPTAWVEKWLQGSEGKSCDALERGEGGHAEGIVVGRWWLLGRTKEEMGADPGAWKRRKGDPSE
jgi:hypothetical protein